MESYVEVGNLQRPITRRLASFQGTININFVCLPKGTRGVADQTKAVHCGNCFVPTQFNFACTPNSFPRILSRWIVVVDERFPPLI